PRRISEPTVLFTLPIPAVRTSGSLHAEKLRERIAMTLNPFRRLLARRPRRRHIQLRAVQFEALEDRILLSGAPQLLKDVNPGTDGSFSVEFTMVGGT